MAAENGPRIDATFDAVFRCNDAPAGGVFARHVGNRTTVRFWGAPRRIKRPETVRWGAIQRLHDDAMLHVLVCPPARIWQYASRCWDELHLANATRLRAWLAAGHRAELEGAATRRWSARGGAALTALQRRAVRSPRVNPNVTVVLRQWMRQLTHMKATRHEGMRWLNGYPTTGASALFTALRRCKRVAVFGFGNASCSIAAAQRGKYFIRSFGRRAYLSVLALGHDYELEQAWIRRLVHDGRIEDAEGCFK